jgi:hypothetical protein
MMKTAADGLPEVGDTFARLGVRPTGPGRQGDVRAATPSDPVRPGEGGMSVAADSPNNLPAHMRKPAARHPVWEIDSADLGDGLIASAAGPPHHHIEPDREMTLDELQSLIAATRTRWVRVQ